MGKGLSVPDSEMIVKIAEIFEIPVSELLGEKLEKTESESELRIIAAKLEQLNAMIAEKNARQKKISRIIAIVLIVIFIIVLLMTVIPQIMILFGSISIGVIGGADGPTSVFISAEPSYARMIISIVISVIGIISAAILLHRNKKNT